MPLTTPDPKTPATENQLSSLSNAAAALPAVTAVDDDGWTVQSASLSGPTAEELKARSESVKVEDQKGRRDVRPAAKPGEAQAPPAKKKDAPLVAEDEDDEDAPLAADEDEDDEVAPPAKKKDAPAPATDDDEDEAAAPSPAAEDDEDEVAPPARKPSRLERRQAKIQREIDAKVAESRRLDRELDERRRKLTEAPAPPKAPAAKTTTEAEDAKPTWKQYQADGKDWDEYQDARDAWAVREYERKTAAAPSAEEIAQRVDERNRVREQARDFVKQTDAAKAKYPDWQERIADLDTVDNTPFIETMIAGSRQGAELMYYLGRRLDLADKLSELTAPGADGQGRLNPRHRPILEALRDSTSPKKLLRVLVTDGHFQRISGLPVARAFKALYELESTVATAPPNGKVERGTGAKKHDTAPPLRPPAGAKAAGAKTSAATPGSASDDLAAEYARENAADRLRHRRF